MTKTIRALCLWILVLLAAVALAEPVARLHPLVQLPLWIVLGLAWVIPCRPLLLWIETGRFRP